MSMVMDLLRAPALGIVFLMFFLGGAILIAAFAALAAQFGILFKMRPWRTEQYSATRQTEHSQRANSKPFAVLEQNTGEVVDAVWWQEVR